MRKENETFSLWQRFGALILSAVMVLGMLPATGSAETGTETGTAGVIDTWTDPETLTRPQTIYGDNTLNAGKVTVGKSVSDSAITVDGKTVSLTGENNFLITMSQSAQVVGLAAQSSVPVDVVFVLDTSGSMEDNNRATTMVTAANSAIATLMAANDQNRIAVVAFSSKGTYGGGTSGGAAANVLSSLAHYDGDAATSHLQWVDSQGGTSGDRTYIAGRDPATITVGNGWYQQTLNVTAFRHGRNGGTNIQAGITVGAQLLTAVTNTTYTDPDNNQTVTRIPFLIVLSDGQPTFSYTDEEWYAAEASSTEQGPGSSAYEGNGFLTALTAAYYKGLITEHYYGDKANAENRCFVYTMGVQIDSLSGDEKNLAQITLDPATYTTGDYAADGANSYWNYGNTANDNTKNAYYGWEYYWNRFLADPPADFGVRVNGGNQSLWLWTGEGEPEEYYTMQEPDWDDYNSWADYREAVTEYNAWLEWRDANFTEIPGQHYTITAESIEAAKKYVSGVGYTGGLAYNDEYYNASEVSQLETIFKSLVATIQQKAISAPTRVSSGDHNFDGYVTFTDPLGEYMELKDMKGIIADGYFYQGVSAAQYLQTGGNAEFEQLILEVLETRMGMTNSTKITAAQLLAAARASENQAYYKSATDYDNSIVWWGKTYHSGEEDTGMQVLGAADNDTIDYITSATNIPEGAEYVCRSYFFYGEAGGANTNPDHQYLYFVVRVQRSLTAPYQQTVVVSAPASLLSMEKVLITESYDDDNNKVYTAAVEEESPLRVVYEVGLWDNITAENVSAVVSSTYAAEVPKDGKGQANVELNEQNQEVYHFFTNDWDRNQSQGSHHRAQTKVTFDAAADNAFYTYQEDTLLVDASGNPITSQPKAGDVVYYVREYYDWTNATKNEDGTYTATLKTEKIAITVPDDTTIPVNGDGQYYIPKGTYTAATLIVNGDDTEKKPNETDTSEIVAHPHRTGETNNSHYTVYLGNNGVISLVSNPPVPEKTVENVTQEIVDADGNSVMVGDVLTYTIKAENYSDKTATIIVTDTVPAGTELVAGSISDGGTVDADGKITWTLTDMASGAVEEVSFQVMVTADSLDNAIVISAITNQATVQIGENGPSYDSNTTTNPPEGKKVTDTDGTAVDGDVQVGDILMFSIEFHNDADAAADITITDIIPTGTTFLSADHNGTLSEDGTSIKWVIDDVAPGAGGVVSFLVQVNADAEDPIVNNASIQIGTNDPKQTNDTVTPVADGNLVLKKLLAEGDNADGKIFTLNLTESTGTLNGTYTLVSSVSGETTVTFVDGKATVTIAAGETLTIYDLPAGAVITVTEAEKPGWTPSYSSGSVTIVANDTAPATVTVTNDYNTQPVKFQLHGTKTFTGDNFPEGTFTFKAQECDAQGNVKEGGIVVTAIATYDGTTRTVTIDFSERTFTGPIDRYYLITEDETTLPGVTTDDAKYLLHLVVTDNGEGQLVLTQTLQKWDGTQWVDAEKVTFANTYAPKETAITIGGLKTLTGRYLDAGEFSFQLIDAATEKVIATATNTADSNTSGAFVFPTITYTEEGTYTYYVREVNAGAANTTYDDTYFMVVVTVTDVGGQLKATQKIYKYVADEQGNYPAEGTEVTAIGYANRYNIQDTSVTLTGTKVLEGADLSAGQFSFTVYETDAAGETKGDAVSVGMNNADGSITFAPIGFTAADMADSVLVDGDYVKDFYFLVVEDIPAADGPTYDANMYYDPTEFLVKVTVTYDPETGSLTAGTPTVVAPTGEDAVVFENIQQPADVQIVPEGTKTTENAPDGVSFSFSVINTETGNEAAVGVGAANGDISFSVMSFSEEGTYTYWIVESNAGNTTNGITYDATRYLMKVVVTRDEYRKLHATVTYYAAVDGKDGSTNVADYTVLLTGDAVPSFQNKYEAGGYINLAAKKSYNGTLHDGDFAFKLIRQDNGGEIDGIVKSDGTVTFATMYYSLDDIPEDQDSAIIHYVMSEVIPTNAAMPGVTYDTKTYDVYVKITNNGDGTISAVLVDKDGNPLTTDNGETTAYVETGITFTNVYEVATGTEVKIEADKTLTGRELKAGEFGFALYRYDGTEWKNIGTAFNTASGDISFIREYNADTLGHQHFTNLDEDAALEYAVLYRIDEINNHLGGVEYSGVSYYVKVIIEHDEENATYEVESVKYYTDEACTKEAASVVFANRYSTNDTHFTPVGTKVLLGANNAKLDPAGFTFEVIEVYADGTPMTIESAGGKVSNKVVATGTSDSDGKVTFSAVHFADESQCDAVDCTDEGCTGTVHSHYYMIHEPKGSATGVTYSDQTYYVKVVIHDNGKGLLEVKSVTYYSDAFVTEIDDSAVVITNHYGPGYMNLTLELDKAFQVASGESYEYKMNGSEFDFEVYSDEACTQLVTTGSNGPSDENGVAEIIFGTITVDKAGTYTYYIKEVPRDGVTHIDTDTNVIKVVVVVTDDGYGNLTATYTYYGSDGQELTGENRKFTNTYNPADTEVKLEINKALSGKNLNGEEFTFVLTDANGNPVATVTNGADGKAVITLNYDAMDMTGAQQDANGVYTKVFTYTLTESKTVAGGADGTYTYDTSVYTVTVTVTDNGSGKLNASVVVTKDGKAVDTIVFSNSYTPKEITVDLDTGIGAQKLITDASGNVLKREDVVFTFEVRDLEGKLVASGTADASEADENGYIDIDFGTFTFDAAGEYRYLITETVSTKSGYVLDTSIWCTHILVRYDANTGKLYVQDADVYTHLFSGDSHSDSGTQPQTETEPLFVNVYDTTDVNLTLTVDKTLTGRDLKAGEFSFTLYNEDGTIAATGRNHADGTVSFLLDYTLEDLDGATSKTFVYTVKEDKGTLGGVTYDESVYTVTVVVTDNGDGTLSAKVAGKTVTGTGTVDTGIAFVNTYNAAPIKVEFHAVKHMEGMPLSVAYTFQLLDSNGEVVATGTNKMDGSIVFTPELEFTAPGEYLYTMVEVKADQPGVTFDETSFDVKVIVTDDGNGNLLAEVVYSTSDGVYDLPVFINIYTPAGTSAVIKADKDLTGRDLEAGEFSFVLKDSEGNEIETVTNAADGSVTFTAIPYDAVGTYTYTIEEVLPEGAVLNEDGTYTYNGVTYDRTVYTVTVEVTDPGYDGVLDHKITYSINGTEVDAATFTNIYKAQSVDVVLEGTKTLTGKDMTAGEFTFHLVGNGEVIALTNDANGNISFPTLTFSSVGVYTYELYEVKGDNAGITYDSTKYVVTVTVTDDRKGQLVADVVITLNGVEVETIAFTNSYKADSVDVVLEGTKTLTGKDMIAGEFTFHLVGNGETHVLTNDANGNINFPTLTFSSVGVYTYELYEVKGDNAGITYDETKYIVTITVTDDQKGQLVADVKIELNGEEVETIAFHNTYKAEPVSVVLEGTKTLTGKDMSSGEFTFHLVGNGMTLVLTNDAAGNINFPTLVFSSVGVYTYELTEAKGDNAGITYDETKYIVTITVTDDQKGQLVADVKIELNGEEVETIAFHNTYKAEPVGVVLDGVKYLEGKPLNDGEFTFHLVGNGLTLVLTNDANGIINFPTLVYSKVGTYTYELFEVKGENGGVTYDDTVYTVTITVTDDYLGQLHAEVTYTVDGEPRDAAIFTNAYQAEVVGVKLEGVKTLTGKDMTEGEFTFHLVGNGMTLVLTNDADGNINFPTLVYSKAGTYTYQLFEVAGTNAGITYDDTVYTVTVVVTDDYLGQLHAEVTYTVDGDTKEAADFTNTYKAESVGVVLEGTKTLTGKDMTAGEFTFHLVDSRNNVIILTNDANGNINFPTLVYSNAGVYTYELYEVKGDDDNMTYDDTVYTVTVTVTDDLVGKLHATVTYSDTVVFANVYTPDPISVTLEGTKDLTGRDQTAGEFDFEVRDAEGNLVTTGTNTADGDIVFDDIVVDTELEMVLYVSEVKGNDNQIEYDDYVYRVKLVVTNVNGQLVAEVTYMDGAVIFYNEYEEPFSPDTGDDTPLFLYTGMMAVSALAMAVLLLGTKKKERRFF